jgi:hypothetical protein
MSSPEDADPITGRIPENTDLSEVYDCFRPGASCDVCSASLALGNRIEKIADCLAHADRETASSFGVGREEYKQLGLLVSKLHLAVAHHDDLESAMPKIERFTDLLEDATLMLSKTDSQALGSQHLATFRRFHDLGRFVGWALLVSVSSKDVTDDEFDPGTVLDCDRLPAFDSDYDCEVERLETDCDDHGLLPDYDDYPDDEDELTALVDELSGYYLRG